MATTTKTKTNTVKKVEEKNIKIVDEEKELLKEKIASQEKEMSELKAQMELLLKTLNNDNAPKEKDINKNKKTIKFINMTTGGFTIRGTRLYHLDKQFDYQVFSESEARIIVNNMPNAIGNGQLYIADRNFVEECELDYIYDNLINEEILKNLLNNNSEAICDIYNNAPDAQKKIIVDMIVEKQVQGEKVDANVLVDLGELCGIDFMKIEPLEKEE